MTTQERNAGKAFSGLGRGEKHGGGVEEEEEMSDGNRITTKRQKKTEMITQKLKRKKKTKNNWKPPANLFEKKIEKMVRRCQTLLSRNQGPPGVFKRAGQTA